MEIQLYEKLENPIEAIDTMGDWFARSGMFGCQKTEQGKVLALACVSERKSPVQMLREYHLIDGKLADRADSMLAKFRSRGGKHKILSRTSEEAAIELTFEGVADVFRLTHTQAQAEPFYWSSKVDRAGKPLPKTNWATPYARLRMLWARVVSDGVRARCPEVVSGIYTPEEIGDFDGGRGAPVSVVGENGNGTHVVEAAASVPVDRATPATPAQEALLAATPPPAPFVAAVGPDGVLTRETVLAVGKVFGQDFEDCERFLHSSGWLEPGRPPGTLSVRRAQMILDRPEAFLKAVAAFVVAEQHAQAAKEEVNANAAA